MSPQRRTVLRIAGTGAIGTFTGCLGRSGPGEDLSAGIAAVDTHPFAIRNDRPSWDEAGAPGRLVLLDGEERAHELFDSYDLSEERADAIEEFTAEMAYDEERLLFVESVGPNACHDRLEVTNVRLADGELGADAAVPDTSEEDVGCAEVITYPSTLVRITFEKSPPDSARVEVTDGWDETATLSATVEDPIGLDVDSLEGSIRPDGDAEPIATLECDRADLERYPQAFDEDVLVWGNVERDGEPVLGLRVDDDEFDYGDTARIELTNVASETVQTGNRRKYNLQAYTEAGWRDVRVGDGSSEYTDEGVGHAPGEGFEWTFELTEAGITDETGHRGAEVCPDLAAGRYRFVFWGVIDGAVAVAFDLRKR